MHSKVWFWPYTNIVKALVRSSLLELSQVVNPLEPHIVSVSHTGAPKDVCPLHFREIPSSHVVRNIVGRNLHHMPEPNSSIVSSTRLKIILLLCSVSDVFFDLMKLTPSEQRVARFIRLLPFISVQASVMREQTFSVFSSSWFLESTLGFCILSLQQRLTEIILDQD